MDFFTQIFSLLNNFFFNGNVVTGTWQEQILALMTMGLGIFLLFYLFKFILNTIFFWRN